MKKFAFVFFIAIALSFGACKRYTDGPLLSLKSPTSRISNTWEVESASDENGKDVSGSYSPYILTFKKDGTYQVQANISGNLSVVNNGTWEFIDNKKSVVTTFKTNIGNTTITNVDTVEILKLKSKKLWVKNKNNDEVHYIPH